MATTRTASSSSSTTRSSPRDKVQTSHSNPRGRRDEMTHAVVLEEANCSNVNSKEHVQRSPGRAAVSPGAAIHQKKRQLFWRNVVKQFNFTSQEERALLISLTGGVCWTDMSVLPRDFVQRHREIYYLICMPEYERSGAIERDVTRTFSIFERSTVGLRGKDSSVDREASIAAQQSALYRVLNAIAEAEDGYCQGMNFIAALFLVEGLSEADSYALFLYMLKKRHLAGIYHRSSTFLDEYLDHFEVMFRRELPDLYAHLVAQGFALPMYGIEWFTTLFSLSTKVDLACAIFDLFFVGLQDVFLRMGLAILKLLEAKLMCMTFEDFLREFKPLVRDIDPYQAVLQALALKPNPKMSGDEDTTAHVSREHFLRAAGATAPASSSDTTTSSSDGGSMDSEDDAVAPPRSFGLHRTLPPDLAEAVRSGNGSLVRRMWQSHVQSRHYSVAAGIVLANEVLHFAVWYGRVSVASLAIDRCGADVDNRDDAGLTPLHFGVLRNQPDLVRLLLVHGARLQETSMRRLSPLELAHRWKRSDTTAARLVLEKEEICLFCNVKFDVLALETTVCGSCGFRFCCKPPHALCIFKHQCSGLSSCSNRRQRSRWLSRDRRLSEPTMLMSCDEGDDLSSDQQAEAEAETEAEKAVIDACDACFPSKLRDSSLSSATTVSSSSRQSSSQGLSLTRSVSESSSLGFANSPAATAWLSSPRFLEDVGAFPSAPTSAPALGDDRSRRQASWLMGSSSGAKPALEFPDRPRWYCNARECHAVFAPLFTQALECARCEGFFCSEHLEGKPKHCLECRRDLLRTGSASATTEPPSSDPHSQS